MMCDIWLIRIRISHIMYTMSVKLILIKEINNL